MLHIVHHITNLGNKNVQIINGQLPVHRFIDHLIGFIRLFQVQQALNPKQGKLDISLPGDIVQVRQRLVIQLGVDQCLGL